VNPVLSHLISSILSLLHDCLIGHLSFSSPTQIEAQGKKRMRQKAGELSLPFLFKEKEGNKKGTAK
jgi:hypothetical protein